MKKALTCMALVLAVVLCLSPVCFGAKSGGTLMVAIADDADQFDPHKGRTTSVGRPLSMSCQGLLGGNAGNDPKPQLAESWDISDDGLTWTFHLRKGVKFHNGRDLTSKEVLWNFDRIMDPDTKASQGSALRGAVESVTAPDKYTIVFKIKRASASFISNFYGVYGKTVIIAPESVDKDGNVDLPIGTGPFIFKEWRPNELQKFVKFNDYWEKGLPYLDEVHVNIVPEETVRLTALQTGQMDMADNFAPGEAANLIKQKKMKGYTLSMDGLSSTMMIHFNVSKPPFNDVRVRQALAYGIDKDEINLGSLDGMGKVVAHCFPPPSPWNIEMSGLKRDVAKSKALLKEAGYPNGLEMRIFTANTYPNWVRASQIVQAQLAEVGMVVKLDIVDWPTVVKISGTQDWQVGLAAWGMRADPGNTYPALFTPTGRFAFLTGKAYDNPIITNAIEKADQVFDMAERKKHYAEMTKELIKDAPWIFLVNQPTSYGWRTDVKGFKEQVIGGEFCYSGGGLQYTWLDR